MQRKGLYIYALCLILWVGCASATDYQKQGSDGGFSEMQLGPQTFRVTFKGNRSTSRERVVDFTLLRSAEIALAHGFQYFVIIDSDRYTETSSYTSPVTTETSINPNGTATSRTTGGETFFFSEPRAANVILCFQERPQVQEMVYDASFLVRSIKARYDIQP